MRNIKLTETEWKYICDALLHSGDLVDTWVKGDDGYGAQELKRKIAILNRAEHKVFITKRETK